MGLLVPYIRNADESIVRVKDGFYIASTKEMGPYLLKSSYTAGQSPRFIGQRNQVHV